MRKDIAFIWKLLQVPALDCLVPYDQNTIQQQLELFRLPISLFHYVNKLGGQRNEASQPWVTALQKFTRISNIQVYYVISEQDQRRRHFATMAP